MRKALKGHPATLAQQAQTEATAQVSTSSRLSTHSLNAMLMSTIKSFSSLLMQRSKCVKTAYGHQLT
jgi:hypothetical protein